MILIISSLLDRHARVVAHALARRGVPAFIGDVMEFGAGARLSARNGDLHWSRADGATANIAQTRAVWCRRNFTPNFDPAMSDPCDREFARRQWTEFLWGSVYALDVALVNDPYLQQAATKTLQLSEARKIGLRVPDTLITNQASAVLDFVERHRGRVIHKTLGTAMDQTLFTKRWDGRDAEALNCLDLAPMIFQEQVRGHREVRVTLLGEAVFAAEFDTGGKIDGRADVDVPYRVHDLPQEVVDRLQALMARLGLAYATVDLRIDGEGDYLFLELNPQGQFLYVEIKTGLPITEAMADLLTGSDSDAHSGAHRMPVDPPAALLAAPRGDTSRWSAGSRLAS